MRWRQTKCEETGKYIMVPIDAAARKLETSAAVRGDIEPYISPIDRSVITGRKSLREHMDKHSVVLLDDYGTKGWEDAAKKREDHHNAITSKQETQARKEQINEVWNHHQRNQ
jgi:hypothetical protein